MSHKELHEVFCKEDKKVDRSVAKGISVLKALTDYSK
jgi:hypothetical protein